MLDTKTPDSRLFRLGRKPNPWSPPDWSRALPNGTFGNRFDDPQGNYRVLYAATQRVSCFVETLARFRPDLSLIAELQEIAGEDDYVPLGTVPSDWCDRRVMGAATVTGAYADIYSAGWVSYLRQTLASDCVALGIEDLDDSVLQLGEPRRLTQLASLKVNEAGLDGIYYRSRYGHNLENWALFEPVPRQNYDLPLNQSDRSVSSFAWFSVSNWLHAAPVDASVRIVCPVLLPSSRSALGESVPAAATCRSEAEASAAEVQGSGQDLLGSLE